MGQAFGAKIVRAGRLMHGKTDQIHHDNRGLYEGLDNPFTATRYHSLLIQPRHAARRFSRSAPGANAPDGSREIYGHAATRPSRCTASSSIRELS